MTIGGVVSDRLPTMVRTRASRASIRLPSTGLATCLLALGGFLCGCSSRPTFEPPPATLALSGMDYETCFEQVVEVARDQGMPAVLRDRSGGLIETAPRISGSLFEPWRQDNASFVAGLENTIAFQRRRARFEFVPAGFMAPEPTDPETLDGPPLPGAKDDDLLDMQTYDGPIEVRIWVYVERAFTPGMRNGTWTRSQTTFTSDRLNPARGSSTDTAFDRSKWTPVRRDEPYERLLLEALDKRMGRGPRTS